MMARTNTWRQPQQRWAAYFAAWTQQPDPKALMLTCVFFDLRYIHGRASLLDDLRRHVLQQTQANRIFLAYMVGNALMHRPPLSLFGGLSTIRSGAHRDTIDLKHSAIVPIVDLARIYALAGGHAAVNTHDRLAVAADSKEISPQSAHDLRDALEFISTLRIRHQALQLAGGGPADNFIALDEPEQLRTQPAERRLRGGADPAKRAGPALPLSGRTLLSTSGARSRSSALPRGPGPGCARPVRPAAGSVSGTPRR